MTGFRRRARFFACALFFFVCRAAFGAGQAAQPPHLDLDIALDPAARTFRATAQLPAPREFRFALYETLTITRASANGRTAAVSASTPQHNVREWRIAAPEGSLVRIEYDGTLPALDPALDHRAVLAITAPMTSPEGTFLHGGSHWYPDPGALFTYRVRITVPAEQRALVAGRLSQESLPSPAEPRYAATFDFVHPAEGIDLMAGRYVIRERTLPRKGADAIRLRTYFTPELAALADGYLEDSARYLERYSEEIGAYPYTEFSIVAAPLPTGFGMPTLTYLGAQVLKLPFIRATSLGHEVLHNWWGNGVYPDYAQGNWSEGLTTFMADYAYKERASAAAAKEMRLSWLRDFAAVPPGEQQPLTRFRSRVHGADAAVGYGKAAMVFFMLRDAIGESAFQRGIREFWQTCRFKAASWEDVRMAFERASGRALKPFFAQWIERAGGPKIAIEAAAARAAKGSIALTISQSAPPYFLHVPIALMRGTDAETRWIDIAAERQTVTLPVAALPDHVALDRDLRVWRVLEPEELPPILRRWMVARRPHLVIASAGAEVRSAALTLAHALLEAEPVIDTHIADTRGEPLLLIGVQEEVDRAVAQLGIRARPESVAYRGTAQVWTVQGTASAPIAVISARDATALAALERPLPHYGSQSYLIFEGSKLVDRGVWPAASRTVPVVAR